MSLNPSMFPKLASVIDYLDALSERANLAVLEKILKSALLTTDDVKEACIFNDLHYARNKISSGEWYDLYVMCWKPGQASAIHDHAGSSCALKILEGIVTEVACELTDRQNSYVSPGKITKYHTNQICLAQDNQIHQIQNASSDVNLITMHIYSPPLRMNVYEFQPTWESSPEHR